jgi:heptosyltransferase-1
MLSLLDALDLPPEPADFGGDLLLPETAATVREILAAETGPRVVIVPGAGWDNKRYPPPLWGEVSRLLAADPGIPSWVLPGPGEEPLAREVVDASQQSAQVLSLPGLDALAAVLRRADLVIGGDTGPLHLAQALGRSVLCLMGPCGTNNPAVFATRGAPRRDPVSTICTPIWWPSEPASCSRGRQRPVGQDH